MLYEKPAGLSEAPKPRRSMAYTVKFCSSVLIFLQEHQSSEKYYVKVLYMFTGSIHTVGQNFLIATQKQSVSLCII
jgi:hypothetical protein